MGRQFRQREHVASLTCQLAERTEVRVTRLDTDGCSGAQIW